MAGPHPLTLYGLSHVFERERDCNVLAICTGPDAIVEAMRRHQPDLLILDLDRNGGLSVLRRVHREQPSARIVVLAGASDNRETSSALRLGAHAVISKELPPESLVTHIRNVHAGTSATCPPDRPPFETEDAKPFAGRLAKAHSPMRHITRRLTPREAEIARLAVRGIPTRDIAAHLGLKQGTVKIHLHSIYEKLNVDGRVGLVLIGRRHGLS